MTIRLAYPETSLVIQWLRICLPMQSTQVRSLVRELRSHSCEGQLSPHVTTKNPTQPKETTVPYLMGLLGGLNEMLITVCSKHSKVTNIMSLFYPITTLLLARTLARGRKSVSNLAHLTEKSRGVPVAGVAWSWDSTGIVRPWSLSLSPSPSSLSFLWCSSILRQAFPSWWQDGNSIPLYPSKFKSSRRRCSLYLSRACTNLRIQSDNTSTNHCSSFYWLLTRLSTFSFSWHSSH